MEKNNKIKLLNVTLFAVTSIKIEETIYAMKKSMENIEFGEVLLLTNEKINLSNEGIRVINIEKLDYNGYSKFVAYKAHEYINTDFGLLVQYDGYVLNPEKWDPIFLNYDYIGAPWLPNIYFTNDGTNVRVGNGGFSLRSKKLLNALNELNLPFTDNGTGYFHEDGVICSYYRKELENYGIKFAPVDIAARFSHESDCVESVSKPFGFHGSKILLPRFLSPVKKVLRKLGIRI